MANGNQEILAELRRRQTAATTPNIAQTRQPRAQIPPALGENRMTFRSDVGQTQTGIPLGFQGPLARSPAATTSKEKRDILAGKVLPPSEGEVSALPPTEVPVSSATAGGVDPFGKGGTVSTFDNRTALGRLHEANRIRRGFIDERDQRAQQRRLQDLAFNTPATLDNISAIKGAQKLLLGQTEAGGREAAAQAKARADQQLTPKQKADIRFKELEAQRANRRLNREEQTELRKQAEQVTNQTIKVQEFQSEQTQSSLSRLVPTENVDDTTKSLNQIRRGRVDKLLQGTDAQFTDPELSSIVTNIPDLLDVFSSGLAEEGGVGPAADALGPIANLRDVLNIFAGFEGLGPTTFLPRIFGEQPNVLVNVAEGGTEDFDFERLIDEGNLPQDVRDRARTAFAILTDRTNATAISFVNKVLPTPAAREEYWDRVSHNRPDLTARGGDPRRIPLGG